MKDQTRVALIGRANVGKSTLFNRLTARGGAIVSDIAGTTRDRKEGICQWRDRSFIVIDTGGLDVDLHKNIEKQVLEQTQQALADADSILFLVDLKTGLNPTDLSIAKLLRAQKKPLLLVANKADGNKERANLAELYRLGLGDPWPVSAVTGAGSGDLLDKLYTSARGTLFPEVQSIKVALIGKPNVGKSSLINALAGEGRAIVHDEPYTTRDANDIQLKLNDVAVTLIDTAGIRKKNKIDKKSIEHQSVEQSMRTIERADIVLFMTESDKPLTIQDRILAGEIEKSKAGVIRIANKWDLIPDKDEKRINDFMRYYDVKLNFLSWAPMIFMSAKDKTKLGLLKKTILTVYEEKFRRIDDNALSKFLQKLVKHHKPTRGKGTNRPYIYRIKQIDVNPPQFMVQIDAQTNLHASYLHFIEKKLREKFGFVGAPIKIWVKKFKTE